MAPAPAWPRRLWWLLRLTVGEATRQPLHRMAAALAFFALFGLPALAVVLLLVGGAVFGDEEARAGILDPVEIHLGAEARAIVADVLDHTPRPERGGLGAGLFGLLALVLGATATFHHLQGVLNRIWDAPRRTGWWRFVAVAVKRLATFLLVVGTGILLLGWLAASTLLDTFPDDLANVLPAGVVAFVEGGVERVLSFAFLTLHFALLFKVLPDAHVPTLGALLGGALTGLLFLVGKHFVTIYLRYAAFTSAYGAASSLVVTLVWFYAGALVVLVGAVFARAYARWRILLPGVSLGGPGGRP